TEVLARLDHSVDLEGLANHRGSSFGKRATPQPAQIDFENALAIRLLKMQAAGTRQFVLEDEARLVGRCSIPLALFHGMQRYPLVWLEDSLEGRVTRILKDYVIDLCAEFVVEQGEEGFAAFAERLQQSLDNIHKRLGGENYKRLAAIMDQALAEQARSGSVDLHREWLEALLRDYYDPMYGYQRQNKASRIEFAGEQDAVVEYLRQRATQVNPRTRRKELDLAVNAGNRPDRLCRQDRLSQQLRHATGCGLAGAEPRRGRRLCRHRELFQGLGAAHRRQDPAAVRSLPWLHRKGQESALLSTRVPRRSLTDLARSG